MTRHLLIGSDAALAELGQGSAQVVAGRRLADPPLLVQNSEHKHGVPYLPGSVRCTVHRSLGPQELLSARLAVHHQ